MKGHFQLNRNIIDNALKKNDEEFERSMQSIFGKNWSNDCNMSEVQ